MYNIIGYPRNHFCLCYLLKHYWPTLPSVIMSGKSNKIRNKCFIKWRKLGLQYQLALLHDQLNMRIRSCLMGDSKSKLYSGSNSVNMYLCISPLVGTIKSFSLHMLNWTTRRNTSTPGSISIIQV